MLKQLTILGISASILAMPAQSSDDLYAPTSKGIRVVSINCMPGQYVMKGKQLIEIECDDERQLVRAHKSGYVSDLSVEVGYKYMGPKVLLARIKTEETDDIDPDRPLSYVSVAKTPPVTKSSPKK
jgi:pyruvate/2-oxoglutarate dehydrogenase complex dihydrolipoamide acyltransferase (E2) component